MAVDLFRRRKLCHHPFGPAMLNLGRKLTSYAETVRSLRQARIAYASIFLYPVRRRGRNARCEVELDNGMSLVSPPREPLINLIKEVFVDDCYRLAELRLRPGEAIVDIGANVGTFALAAASAFPDVTILCVEPDARAYVFLEHNVGRNRLRQVRTINAACGGSSGERTLYARQLELNDPSTRSTLYETDNYGSSFAPIERVSVVTLDRLLSTHRIEACGLLKLDCEGAEYEILLNAGGSVLSKIERIAMEYHVGLTDHAPEELVTRLERSGFAVERHPLLDEEGGYLYAWRERSG